jgi:misacylated tRNA(Ala) deacylase
VTELLHQTDAYARSFTATVTRVHEGSIALDRTAFYATGGGQPHDTGVLVFQPEGAPAPRRALVTSVRKENGEVWHSLDGPLPNEGDRVEGEIDWDRRHALMRTHSALHVLCGVIAREWGVAVTGGNMEPLSARMDFELDPTPEGFGPRVEELVNAELRADRPIEVSFLARSEAIQDPSLIRTKVSLVPDNVPEVRVVEIVGLDRQADGGLHVRSTSEVGGIRVVKTESKGKGNKRIRIEVLDAAAIS